MYFQAHLRTTLEVGEDFLGSPRNNEPVLVQEVVERGYEVVKIRRVAEGERDPLASEMNYKADILLVVLPIRVLLGEI